MSAYIVAKATIDAIVTAYIALEREADGSFEPPDLSEGLATYDRIGAMLWRENHRSVNARYHSTDSKTRARPYKFVAVPIARPLSSAVLSRVLGAIRGYVYQSAEHDEWSKSDAHRWLVALQIRCEARVEQRPSRYTSPAWQVRPVYTGWTIEDRERATVLTKDSCARAIAEANSSA